jgi:N-acetylglutamate synthase-like GNAT family acetyltransferase
MIEVTTYYLEMKSKDSLLEKKKLKEIEIIEAEVKQYRFNRFLYRFIGENWNWNNKLKLSSKEWKKYAESDNLRTWVAYYKGSIAGYYELEKQLEYIVEITCFGLSPYFIGNGFGGYLLSHAIKNAWALEGTKRVWVHTCSLDHKNALSNYKARGFHLYREENSPKSSAVET